MSDNRAYKIIISGGGTGGHIFPAIAIADELKRILPHVEFLFVGAKGRMEMEKIPAAGYNIIGLDVVGFQRGQILKNILFPIKLIKSLLHAFKIVRNFKPDLAIGVGGYASGPTLFVAGLQGVPTVIQEQNFYPGITNKILAKTVKKIFVAYEGMEVFFPKNKIIISGNPVRGAITRLPNRAIAIKALGLHSDKPTVFVMGGSLGARTINESIIPHIPYFVEKDIQLIWQTGKLYYKDIVAQLPDLPNHIMVKEFIQNMDDCYTAADIIISRAGAISISELCIVGKPIILVPSPNVSEDHQTKNAMALVNNEAAILVKDVDAREQLCHTLFALLEDKNKQNNLTNNIQKMALPNATQQIATTVREMIASV